MPAGIREVAARAGVAVGTVSRVLNDAPGVSAPTRERVHRVIAELEYRPNLRARALSTGRTHTVSAIVPFFTHPSSVARLRGVVEGLEASGYDLVLFNVGAARLGRDLAETHAAERSDGVLVVSLRPSDAEVRRLRRPGVPVVLVDAEHRALPRVVIDDVAGGRLAAEHLLALGHRRIAFVGDLPDRTGRFVSSQRRESGYRLALAAAGAPPVPELVRLGPHDARHARRDAAALLALEDPPTAIVAASDTQALGALDAAAERGLAAGAPGGLSVVGFDDLETAAHVGLTTVRQPLRESGRLGAELLLAALSGEPAAEQEHRLGLELVVRRTTSEP
ncbi:MAG TPA: LacI family DNA-binding transcriptional regulator [Solirubrobacteraceae bacterium]|jgi:LacI family transcriptional regulator